MEKWISSATLGFGDMYGQSPSDRLSSKVTVRILAALILAVTVYPLLGNNPPMKCLLPKDVSDAHADYLNSHCWKNSYINSTDGSPHKVYLNFYKYTSLMLLMQLIAFGIPGLVWYVACRFYELSVPFVIDCATQYHQSSKDEGVIVFCNFTKRIYRYLKERQQEKLLVGSTWRIAYLPVMYLITQFLYLANAITQMVLLVLFLKLNGQSGLAFGLHVFRAIMVFFFWREPEARLSYFPEVSFCDVDVKQLGKFTLQCTMSMNYFYETIFFFLWLWYLMLAVLYVLSICVWISRLYVENHYRWMSVRLNIMHRTARVSHSPVRSLLQGKFGDYWESIQEEIWEKLEPKPKMQAVDKEYVRTFYHDFLMRDGLFLYYLVMANTSEVTADLVLYQLWANFVYRTNVPNGLTIKQETRQDRNKLQMALEKWKRTEERGSAAERRTLLGHTRVAPMGYRTGEHGQASTQKGGAAAAAEGRTPPGDKAAGAAKQFDFDIAERVEPRRKGARSEQADYRTGEQDGVVLETSAEVHPRSDDDKSDECKMEDETKKL